MRIALVINTSSGSGSIAPDRIRDKIAAAGLDAVPETNDTAPLPARLAIAAALPKIDALVVAGGDGTMGCAASLLAGRDTPLGVLPLGTMNLLAKDLGVPRDLDQAIDVIRAGARRRIDLGDVNGHVFLTSSLIGMPARMAKHREAQREHRDARGVARFLGGLVRHLGRYPRTTVSVTLDDGAARTWRLRLLAVVNNDFVERRGDILVREPLDGDRLTVYLLRDLSLWRMLRLAGGVALGDWHRLPGLERDVATTIAITSPHGALRVMNDGEVQLMRAPLRYSVRPKALTVIAPRQAP